MTQTLCDRCGKVIKDGDWCTISEAEVGTDFLYEYDKLGMLQLCDDCYAAFRMKQRNLIKSYMEVCE